jgi:hypothetical protein
MSSYADKDMQSIAFATQDLMRDMGAKDASDVLNKMQQSEKQTQHVELSKVMRNIMDSKYYHDLTYQRNTDLLAQMNEAWNANRYIVNAISKEQKRISTLDTDAKRDMYSVRQSYSYANYMNNYYRMTTSVLIFTTIVTILLLIPAAMWRQNRLSSYLLVAIDGILLALYLVILLVVFKGMGVRRENNWDQIYWRVSKNIQDQANQNSQNNSMCNRE